jgi:hypothetical protein
MMNASFCSFGIGKNYFIVLDDANKKGLDLGRTGGSKKN